MLTSLSWISGAQCDKSDRRSQVTLEQDAYFLRGTDLCLTSCPPSAGLKMETSKTSLLIITFSE